MAPKPVAFMVMPYGTRSTGVEAPGVPKRIDFDDLWNEVYYPVLAVDYTPVRADHETGALIIVEMIQRLAAADLVLADITLPNANVYYEVGVRHAARRTGCVLVGADWADLAFDLRQIRQLRFPLTSEKLDADGAKFARDQLAASLEDMAQGTSPVFQAVPDFPDQDVARLEAFHAYVAEMTKFDAAVRAIEFAPSGERSALIEQFLVTYPPRSFRSTGVALTVLELVRDHSTMEHTLDFIHQLRPEVASDETIQEQKFLVQAKTGDIGQAAAALQALIDQVGPSSERWGLLGGRYKQMWRAAENPADKHRFLEAAIDAYEHGVREDLNDYYPASNLPRLYASRDEPSELEIHVAAVHAMVACQRAIDKGLADEWARPTLLGLAFDRGDFEAADAALKQIRKEGAHQWKLETTMSDLETSLGELPEGKQAALEPLLVEMRALITG